MNILRFIANNFRVKKYINREFYSSIIARPSYDVALSLRGSAELPVWIESGVPLLQYIWDNLVVGDETDGECYVFETHQRFRHTDCDVAINKSALCWNPLM